MGKKIICLILFAGLVFGCGASVREGVPLTSSSTYKSLADRMDGDNALAFNPQEDVEAALPDMRDLPIPASLNKGKKVRLYTGIIKNKTRYDVEVPSSNSSASLIIPAKGWIEYISWVPRFDLTAYHDGKPFYCMKIYANPKNYSFMCQKYDFLIEIVKAEPASKPKKKMKRAIKKKKKSPEGVEGVG
jgi:hypothetical protein